ncbi:TetR/AcrR family transcriptional regulator [Paenibacillus sp. MWE-103]|uniref:TetR/AcrR family transcriptional regulator n=1 Tax=Paenibacillus artemisiicola TaxID=1172618 RepID=A0ABS3W7E3_9BACL|nr:TetR/AcrR family transcriptional regulator [Paenibacillus artemisiicola]MBO7744222.1 TetR/AcrR family transcriptional regulator [Paenibacillus artemisiicola]
MARSKEYDEPEVLDKAMRLFWEQGYEKTSMTDLVDHMGIHRRSLYDAFGDKRTLFLKALDRYGSFIAGNLKAGIKQAETAADALRFVFKYAIDDKEGCPSGCLLVSSAVELAARDEEADAKTVHGFESGEELMAGIIAWGRQNGEFTSAVAAKELAESLHNALLGIRVLSRTSVSREKLYRIVDVSMGLLR